MTGNNRIRIINTTFVVVSRLEFTTSVSANMSRMMIASPKSVLSMGVLLLLRCRSKLRAGQFESSTIRCKCPYDLGRVDTRGLSHEHLDRGAHCFLIQPAVRVLAG